MVASAAINGLLITVPMISSWGEVVHMAAVTTTEWIRPESWSIAAWTFRFARLWLHAEKPLVALLGLVHRRIQLPFFFLSSSVLQSDVVQIAPGALSAHVR